MLTITVGSIAGIALFLLPKNINSDILINSANIVKSPIDTYSQTGNTVVKVVSDVITNDARPVIVDNFLAKNHSPMAGMGETFVFVADRYSIDWRLLPAIAFQESNLGKKIPKDSYNAFGWAVFSGKNSGVKFTSWEQAIEIVAKGIKERYINNGLTTPEAIMTRYTPNDDGTWVFAVETAMAEMSQ